MLLVLVEIGCRGRVPKVKACACGTATITVSLHMSSAAVETAPADLPEGRLYG
ncbi:MAG TPA: hypothetical protein VFG71_10160 [Nitrospiraceae bacterium]|nr:hypothetical protein [Nitrospiraceae bacterium]